MTNDNEKLMKEIDQLMQTAENVEEQIDIYCMFMKQVILNTSSLN